MSRSVELIAPGRLGRVIVVGAAVVRGGRVLAARRSAPAEEAGRWEFPGGKVERGETESAALVRECLEELGVAVIVGTLLGSAPIRPGLGLRVYACTIAAGDPVALQDHDELRWLCAASLAAIEWLPADRPFLAAVAKLLRR
jgi:8-oxo-dGTP diphosphatase